DRNRSSFSNRFGEFVTVVNVVNRIAIGNHIAIELPGAAQLVDEKEVVGACGLAVDAVVGTHHRLGLAFDNRRAECGQIGVFHIVLRGGDVHGVSHGFGAAVHGEVLGRRDDTEVLGIVALHSGYEGNSHFAGEEWIFAVGL